MDELQRLLGALELFSRERNDESYCAVQQVANAVLINSAGYCCVELVCALQHYGWRVKVHQLLGEPKPMLAGTISRESINIHFGAVMTPCQKRLMRLLDDVDEAFLNQPNVDTSTKPDLTNDSVIRSEELRVACNNFLGLARQVFFEPSVRRVRFGELVLFCKEADIKLDSSDNGKDFSYFKISTSDYSLRVEHRWS